MWKLKEYIRPDSVTEAVAIKQHHGPRAAYLSGGSDLMVCRPEDIETVIDIRHIGLGYVRDEDDALVIGGAALLRDAEARARHVAGGMLTAAFRDTAPWLIRNVATVAGNIANASPAADSVPALIALDARIVVSGTSEQMPVHDVFAGPHQTNLGNALIEQIRVPSSSHSVRAKFFKLARSASDIALVNLAVSCDIQDGVFHRVRISLGAVAPIPVRAVLTESLLEGQAVSRDLLWEAGETVKKEITPISDWRASAQYRSRMSGVLLRRALESFTTPEERNLNA
ncbi:MAG TPA: FAD binding domain-containing protein [Chloroflexota bacterium]